MNIQASYAACEQLARTHYENFPVASRLLPSRLRPHVAAVYAFARTADDIADEPGLETSERLRLLAEYRQRVTGRAAATSASATATTGKSDARRSTPGSRLPAPDSRLPSPASRPSTPDSRLPPSPRLRRTGPTPDVIFPALFDTIDRFELPESLFIDLLSAFEQDVTVTRYATWDDVLDYCRRSADPVGRIVLRLSGYRTDALDHASDAVCTALQLTNFWQDLAVDWSRGRLYVPDEISRAHGADPRDLDRGAWTPAWRAALEDCGHRTRALFDRGRAVCDGVGGRLRYELRATWLGGSRILERLEHHQFDVFASRPSLGAMDGMVIACRALAWRRVP